MTSRMNMERSTADMKKKSPDGLTVVRAYPPPKGGYSPKQWMTLLALVVWRIRIQPMFALVCVVRGD